MNLPREHSVQRAIVGLAVLACLMSTGCSDGLGPSESANKACTVTIAGPSAIAGTYTCTSDPITLWVPNTNVGALNISISGGTAITGVFVFTGPPTSGATYSSANSAGLQSYGFIVK